jgi:hypothetical protein
MSEQVFKSPGYYDREIDLTTKTATPLGVPYAIVGASERGPAFVPSSLGSKDDFSVKFGNLNPKFVAPYMVDKVLDNRESILFLRVLGAGANTTTAHFETTRTAGTVTNAGMKLAATAVGNGDNRHAGAVQFIAAKHIVTASEAYGLPMFSDNNSYSMSSNAVFLVRGVIFPSYDARIMVFNTNEAWSDKLDDYATLDDTSTNLTYRKFKLAISSSAGTSFGNADGFAGVKIFTASLDPNNSDYIGKILNTDPERFDTEKHLFYADYAVDAGVAVAASGSGNDNSIAILSGSTNTSANSGLTSLSFRDAFGRYDARYSSPKTPYFISQPFGAVEYDLFYVEALDDGAFATTKFKISISNLHASTDPTNPYGTFTLLVREYDDTDFNIKVLEQFNDLTLNPDDEKYIARIIGDKKVVYNFDVENEDDRRLLVTGRFGNSSKYIRVITSTDVDNKKVPAFVLPFGFRGFGFLNTNSAMTDSTPVAATARLVGSGSSNPRLTGSILPPVPYRFKVTRGEVSSTANFTGEPGSSEVVDSRLFWGVKFERNDNVANPNVSNELNNLLPSLAKFTGIEKLDTLYTGSYADTYCNNKFSLAKVALSVTSVANLTASADQHMKETAYIRNGNPTAPLYTISDGSWGNRLTLATFIITPESASLFNRFSDYTKFTTMLYGGWDGINIFDKNAARFNDRATSTESSSAGYGGANASFTSPGAASGTNYNGSGLNNNAIFSYKVAANIITEPNISYMNLVSFPGIREPLVVDYLGDLVLNKHQLSFCVADIPYYDYNLVRIFDGETRMIDNEKTAEQLDGRAIDNNAMGVYFPNVTIDDKYNNKKVLVPASIPAVGAIAYNDKVAYPWWAPAGFNRAALSYVSLVQSKIRQADRDTFYAARINPIIKFPNEGFVIFSQKNLQQAKSSLSSINVKRMVLEVKRLVVLSASRMIFDNITPDLYERFQKNTTSLLNDVQLKQGINGFRVICDNTNNSSSDVNENRMNGRIELKPTESVEFIQIDFVVLPSGVRFL